MAIKVAANVVDFDRMAQLLERLRVSEPRAERWSAACEELAAIVSAQLALDATARDENENVVAFEPLISAA